ncbi:MAG TPA: A/G-specific adenine glycosylase [Saprospiraceae bacterium]|nr:A/G-specific adenine glycosylase [Saprospiraceae bacterium]
MQWFTKVLLKWHRDNPRPLPWSNGSRNPYHIWLSEIIMQQTRIEQGTSYYLRFIKRYPTVFDLARASQDEVMQMWEGLGYYTRARNLHKAAKFIAENLDGKFPESYEGLLSLPGIGPYSAAAISSFAFGHHHVVVDGNVKRLVSRYSGVTESIDEPQTHEKIRKIAFDFMNGAPPDVFNQAIMNFGALVCKPKPLCNECPLAVKCYAHQHNLSSILPARTKKKLNRTRYFHFIVIHYRGKMLLQRRESNDIWKGLFAPPLLEQKSARAPSKSQVASFIENNIGHACFEHVKSSNPIQQLLTHQTIIGRYYHMKLLCSPKKLPESFVWVNDKTIHSLGKPKMVADQVSSLTQL